MLSTQRATALVFGLFAMGVLTGAATGSAAADRARDPYSELDTFIRVLGLVETNYVDDVPRDKLLSAGIEGLLDELDPHSQWMSEARYRALQNETQGAYTGIGVEIKVDGDGPRITRVLPGSPAARDGLSVGDRIVAVDGTPLGSVDLDGVSEALMGPRGEQTELTIEREGWDEPRTLTTVRDRIRTPAIEPAWLPGHVAYARLSTFQEGSAKELEAALTRMSTEHSIDGVILDLRDNTGGLLREAVGTANVFLDDGPIVSTWSRIESERQTHAATPGGLPRETQVVVLVNGLSASASEIVAAALQDTDRATLVGTRTYGKGSVQTVFEHRDGSALKLTIGRYFTPSGEPVAAREGRVPDIVVEIPRPDDPRTALRQELMALELDDPTAERLLALVDATPATRTATHPTLWWSTPPAERLRVDPQLRAAHALFASD